MHEPPLENWGCYSEHASDLNMTYKRKKVMHLYTKAVLFTPAKLVDYIR